MTAQLRRSGRERESFIVQRDDPRSAQDCLAQPAHAEKQQQHADHELKEVQGNAIEERTEREHDQREGTEARERAQARRPPAAHGCNREHDGERFDRFDERTEKRRGNGGCRCGPGDHEGSSS